jgi:hypothetical protein
MLSEREQLRKVPVGRRALARPWNAHVVHNQFQAGMALGDLSN